MDKKLVPIILKELDKFKTDLENKIIQDPCCKFKVLNELQRIIKYYISLKDINAEIDTVFGKISGYKLLSTTHNKFFGVMLYNCCKYKIDPKDLFHLYGLLYYKLLLNKHIKFCDLSVLQTSYGLQHKSSLLYKFKDVIVVIQHVSDSVYKRYVEKIKQSCDNPVVYVNTIYELRTRISNQVKVIAKRYYQVKQKHKTQIDVENITMLIYRRISIYGNIKKVQRCEILYNRFVHLPDIPENIVKDSIFEIVSLYGSHPSKITTKSIAKALKDMALRVSVNVLKYLNIDVTPENLTCLARTYYASLE